MIHLDTSFLVDLLREHARNEHGPATRKLDELAEQELTLSVHAACELHAGAELSRQPVRERERIAALLGAVQVTGTDERFPARYGAVLAELRRRGETVATMDLLIATAALGDDAILVTRNVREFERIPGLTVLTY